MLLKLVGAIVMAFVIVAGLAWVVEKVIYPMSERGKKHRK